MVVKTKETAPKRTEEIIKGTIFRFLDPSEYEIFIFGSRARGDSKKFSDYDIGIKGKKPVPWETLALIEEAFENSNLPFRVDVVDFSLVSPEFSEVALSKTKKL